MKGRGGPLWFQYGRSGGRTCVTEGSQASRRHAVFSYDGP